MARGTTEIHGCQPAIPHERRIWVFDLGIGVDFTVGADVGLAWLLAAGVLSWAGGEWLVASSGSLPRAPPPPGPRREPAVQSAQACRTCGTSGNAPAP